MLLNFSTFSQKQLFKLFHKKTTIFNFFRNPNVIPRQRASSMERGVVRDDVSKSTDNWNATFQKHRKLLRLSNFCLRRWQFDGQSEFRRIFFSVFVSSSGHDPVLVHSRTRKCQVNYLCLQMIQKLICVFKWSKNLFWSSNDPKTYFNLQKI